MCLTFSRVVTVLAALTCVFLAPMADRWVSPVRGQTSDDLKLNNKGPRVKDLQRFLNEHTPTRLPRLEPDGVYGPRTVARVMEFQHQHGLSADGVVGAKTAALLKRQAKPGAPRGRCILVDLVSKELFAFQDGVDQLHVKPISGGRPSHPSSSGVFHIDKKRRYREYTSKEFPAPPGQRNMDFAQFYQGGQALHQGDPKVQSHGCIHIAPPDAKRLFDWVGKDPNDVRVVVVTP
jgi:hypothetical protein